MWSWVTLINALLRLAQQIYDLLRERSIFQAGRAAEQADNNRKSLQEIDDGRRIYEAEFDRPVDGNNDGVPDDDGFRRD